MNCCKKKKIPYIYAKTLDNAGKMVYNKKQEHLQRIKKGGTDAINYADGGVCIMAKAKKDIKKVVLAYSGGLDTSIIIPWLKENYNNCEVIAVSADVGQGTELDGLEEKAIKTGASKLIVLDLKKTFVEDYISPPYRLVRYMKTVICWVPLLLVRSSVRNWLGSHWKKVQMRSATVQPVRATIRFVSNWQSRHTLRIWRSSLRGENGPSRAVTKKSTMQRLTTFR